ncbi:MAG: phage portal protein [Oxalicibacterium faecigallinarum]|uniref:phage portal protein n=1 Tax=Oxalicibacterium faecigallinarum TaxID=573741 RepID=UPI002807B248|nr:phage portal protein [Oxalicibacterium faecigallinarum]MDQ7970746.1 phage portal protein [Oxalicibacterium faecigallinarum]
MAATKSKQPGRIKSAIAGSLAGWLGQTIKLTDSAFWSAWFGGRNFTGKTVTVNSALQLSTVWACVRLISETLSTLPMNLYRDDGDAKVVAKEHDLHRLLHSMPNADMTASVFWQIFLASMLLWGAAYVEIRRNNRGNIISLDLLLPDLITARRLSSGVIEWKYRNPVTKVARTINESDMWFTPAFTTDGLSVLSPIRMGANVMGAAIAADEASARTFTDGMAPAGVITMDTVLKDKQRDDIRAHVKKVSAEGGVYVLEKGAGFQQLTMNPQDAELISTRSFNVEEICRWFRLDPSLVGHGGKDSNWGTGLEQKMIWMVTLALRPLAVRIEQSVWKNLLTPAERLKYSAEFVLEGLLRGDSAARAAFYGAMTDKGIMTRDECRKKENLPAKGGNADVLTVQSQMIPLDKIGMDKDSEAARNAINDWLSGNDKDPKDET